MPTETAPAWSPDQPTFTLSIMNTEPMLTITKDGELILNPKCTPREIAVALLDAWEREVASRREVARADAEPTPDWMSEDDAGTLLRSLITAGRNKMPLAPIVMEAIRRGGAPASGETP